MVRTSDGGYRFKKASEQAADRRLAEAQKKPWSADKIIERQAQTEAENLQGQHAFQTDQIESCSFTAGL